MANQILRQRHAVLIGLTLILLIAAYLRFGAVNQTVVSNSLRADAGQYFSYAFNLKYRGVYSVARPVPHSHPRPDAYRSPGYPLFLAAFMGDVPPKFVGATPAKSSLDRIKLMLLRVTLVQAFLGLATVLFAFALFRQIVPPVWALAGALLVALSPHLVSMGTYILSESLYTFLCVLVMWLVAQTVRTKSFWVGALAGAVLAAGALTRPTLEYFILPLLVVWFLSGSERTRTRLVPAVLMGFVLVFSPWLVRNEISTGRLSDPRLAIATLQDGMYPDFMYHDITASFGHPDRFDPRSREIGASMNSVLHEIASRFEREPARELRWYLLGKPVTFFSWDIIAGEGDVFVYPVKASPYMDRPLFRATHAMMKGLRWPLVALCLIECASVWKRSHRDEPAASETMLVRRLLATLVLYYLVLHIVGAPYPRYNIPLLPFIFGLAMVPLLTAVRAVGRRYRSTASQPNAV